MSGHGLQKREKPAWGRGLRHSSININSTIEV